MPRPEADRRSLPRAGLLCAMCCCALIAGCRSFYDQPRTIQGNPYSGAPAIAPPVVGAPIAAPAALPPVAAPVVGQPLVSPPVVAAPPAAVGPPALPPPSVAGVPVAGAPIVGVPIAGAPGVPMPAVEGVPTVPAGAPGVMVAPRGGPPPLMPPGYNWQLTLTPARIVAPVGGEVVLVAGLRGADGQPLTSERIEWMLSPDSVGQFMSLGNSGKWFVMSQWCEVPRKITNTYAVASTFASPVSLPAPSANPTVPLQVARGQTWISVSSPTDGTSFVTAFAPHALGQSRQRQTAVIHWVDSQFSFPAPAIAPIGTRQSLSTVVTRQSDGTPLERWIVRYEVTGGAAAGFAPTGATSVEATTDAQGRATVEIFQPQPQRGASQIDVQVIRPAAPGSADRRLTIGRSCTTVTWTAADLGMRVTGPAQATPGAAATYRIELVNSGELAVSGVSVSVPLPGGTRFIKSSLPAQATPASLQWRIERVEPGQTLAIDVDLQMERSGNMQFCATVNAQGGLQGRDCITTAVVGGGLQVRVTGPPTARVGQDVSFHITVTNAGDAPVDGVVINDAFDPGLQHVEAKNRVQFDVGRLAAGQTRDDIDVTFRAAQPGRHCQTVEVVAPGAQGATAQACIEVAAAAGAPAPLPAVPAAPLAPGLSVVKEGPRQVRVGQRELFTLTVRNTGGTTLRNVKVVDKYERGLKPAQASQGYKVENEQLTWIFDRLQPGEQQRLQVEAQAEANVARACTRATVSAEGGLLQMDEACVEIVAAAPAEPAAPRIEPAPGVPAPIPAGPELSAEPAAPEPGALKADLTDFNEEVTVGQLVTYRGTVRNTGRTADFQVVVTVVLPPGMTPVAAGRMPLGATVNGQTIRFAAIAEIRPDEVLPFTIPVRADRAGPMRVEISVTSRAEVRPIVASEETTVLGN